MYISADDPKYLEMMGSYELLMRYATPVKKMERELVGRSHEMAQLMSVFNRPEISNVMLLAAAGTGKTAVVQGCMVRDKKRYYLEVNLSKMIADVHNPDEIASILKEMFDEATRASNSDAEHELVMFMDEFHQIVHLSAAAVEAMKPILADSGTRGLHIVAATTYEEFREYISSNQPLVERFQRLNILEPDKDVCIEILEGMAERYGIKGEIDPLLYGKIYEYTNRYVPANAQPRKSILLLDSMVGWYRSANRKLDEKLLADVIFEQEGVNVSFRVDAATIKERLDRRVLAQQFATSVIEQRLQLCVADLNDHSKPQSTFLFTGSTGTGKCLRSDELIPAIVDGEPKLVPIKDLREMRDYVFNAKGVPVLVVGKFHQGDKKMYRVTFGDGRYLDASGNHLWGVYPNRRSREEGLTIYSTETLLKKGLITRVKNNREAMKYVIPMNGAVQWPDVDFKVDPYVVGAFIGNGLLRDKALTFSSDDEFTVEKIKSLLGAVDTIQYKHGYSWTFGTGKRMANGNRVLLQTEDVFSEIPELIGTYSGQKFIPEKYKLCSIDQRWALIKGLFDTDGCIRYGDGERFNVSYSTTSEQLAKDIQWVLYSLGVASSITSNERDGKNVEYNLHVKIDNWDKHKLFSLPRKLERAEKAAQMRENKQRHREYDYVGIRSIEPLNEVADCTCIYVDDEEHLYQAGDFVVTHNTEMSKQLANILFGNASRSFIRLDCTEFANNDSLDRFRDTMTTQVWEHPYSLIMLDEIEKAAPTVTRILLQVLDDGRLTDRNGRETSFVNSYIVLTTNAGSEIYKSIAQYESSDTGSGEFVGRYESLIRQSLISTTGGNRFPPELLGRVDCIVPFQPLSEKTMERIAKLHLYDLKRKVMKDHHVELDFDKRVLPYIVADNLTTDSDAGGARAVISKIESEIACSVARFLNQHERVVKMYVSVEGVMSVENKNQLSSNAYIKVEGKT